MPFPTLGQIVFLTTATIAVISALLMVTRKDMVHSILWMVVTFFQIAVVYVMLGAEFLAVLQVMVYAGAILVLFLFVVMLLNLRSGHRLSGPQPLSAKLAWPAALALALELIGVILLSSRPPQTSAGDLTGGTNVIWDAAQVAAVGGNAQAVGQTLYTRFLLPFEVSSLILLLAVVGAVVLARKEEPAEVEKIIPSAGTGISLGRRSVGGLPQEEQLEKQLRPTPRSNVPANASSEAGLEESRAEVPVVEHT